MTGKRSDEIYATLKQNILDWVLPPGTPLSEPDLVQQLGASRTPIRESLQQLSRDGLVRLVPRKGAFVTDIAVPDIVELFQMRDALESFASRLAARSDHRAELRAFVPELESAADIIDETDNRAYYDLTSRMDTEIVELAGNKRLGAALTQVWEQVYRARRLAGSNPARLLETIDEHISIVEAIVAGDEDEAARATHEHVQTSMEHVLESVLKRSSLGLPPALNRR